MAEGEEQVQPTEIANEAEINVGEAQIVSEPASLVETSSDEVEAETAPKDVLVLDDTGHVIWNEVVIAKLIPNQPFLEPKLALLGEELNQEETSKLVHERLDSWLNESVYQALSPMFKLKKAIEFVAPEIEAETTIVEPIVVEVEAIEEDKAEASETEAAPSEASTEEAKAKPAKAAPKTLSDAAKEIAQAVLDNHGVLARTGNEAKISALSQETRKELRSIGLRFGRNAIYMPLLLKPKSARLNAILGFFSKGDIEGKAPFLPPFGVTSFEAPEGIEDEAYALVGFKNVGGRAIRFDIIDRVIDALFEAANEAKGPFALPLSVISFLGVSNDVAQKVVESLGWEKLTDEEGNVKWRLARTRPKPPRRDFSKKTEGEAGSENAPRAKKFDNSARPNRPQGENQGYNKRKGPPQKRTPRDFSSSPNKIDADSPFAILAQLKANLEPK